MGNAAALVMADRSVLTKNSPPTWTLPRASSS